MKKLLFFLIAASCMNMKAQDVQTEAKILYSQAEDLLNQDKYKESIQKLISIENTLGSTNPKILYLKIQNYHRLIKMDWNEYENLRSSILKFFELVDKSTYSPDKYLEISAISMNVKEKKNKYEEDFLRLSEGKDFLGFKTFLSEFPNSDYALKLKTVYQLNINQEQAQIERQSYSQKVDLIKDSYKYKLKKRSGRTIALFALTGTYTLLGSIFYGLNENEGSEVFDILGTSFLICGGISGVAAMGVAGSWIALKVKQNNEIKRLHVSFPRYNLRNNSIQIGLSYTF
jgi:hypothetical protein